MMEGLTNDQKGKVIKAILGISTEYVLADKYKRFYVNPTVWGNWGKFQPGKQEQHVLNFLKPLPKPRKTQVITSQDGLMEISLKARPIKLKPGTKGSDKGQRCQGWSRKEDK